MIHRIIPVFIAILTSSLTIRAATEDGRLEVYWVDVEGGAATLIVTPAGESVLIDSGNPGVRDPSRIHRVATETAGLSRIDYLITTHFHLDHFGGAAELARLMPIGTVYDNGIPDRNPDNRPDDTRFPLLVKPYREMQVGERRVINPGDTIPLEQTPGGGELTLTCIGTRQGFIDAPDGAASTSACAEASKKDKDLSDNANSVVMLLEFGEFRFFDGGDLTWNVEAQLVCPENRVGIVDVYQVTHHGLDQSNNPLVVHALQPTVSIMNNGRTKGCNPETFRTLKNAPSIQAMYQAHKNLREDGEHNTADNYIANLEAECDAHFIRLSVAKTGADFVVSIPSNGHSRTFETKPKG